MASVTNEDNLKTVDDEHDKDFNKWRQPTPPESPKPSQELKSNSPEHSVQNKSLCGVKDLSRLSRKRRTLLSARSARLCPRKRSEDKPIGSNTSESKPRTSKKEPLPMKQRSLPQSFWLQPNSMKSSSMAQNNYSRLPPLFPEDHNPNKELTERPVTPPEERQEHKPRPPKRVASAPDTELLFSLFKTVTVNPMEKKLIKRGRPKRIHSEKLKVPSLGHEEDPCMVENLAGRLFPQLSLEHHHRAPINARLSSLTVHTGSQTIELPSLAVDNNYPQMLSQLAQIL